MNAFDSINLRHNFSCQCWSSWLFLILILFSNRWFIATKIRMIIEKMGLFSQRKSSLFKLMSSAFCGIQMPFYLLFFISFVIMIMLDAGHINSPFFLLSLFCFLCFVGKFCFHRSSILRAIIISDDNCSVRMWFENDFPASSFFKLSMFHSEGEQLDICKRKHSTQHMNFDLCYIANDLLILAVAFVILA